ncbi:MAG: hypothetical protein K8T20_08485, partial [Planctomycetes bacterium]|nr:hypothetical protein [Planctomycetota bacterium]
DMAELKKYGWSEAKHKELDKLRLAVRTSITQYGGGPRLAAFAQAGAWENLGLCPERVKRVEGLRRAVPLAKNALEGVADLDSFLKMGDVTSVPKLGRALTDKVGILKRNTKLVAAEGISADFIKEGERLAEALSTTERAKKTVQGPAE